MPKNNIEAQKIQSFDIKIENPNQKCDYLSYNDTNKFCKMINKDTYFIMNSKYDLELIQKEKKNTILSNINSLIKIFPEKKILYFLSNNQLGRLNYDKNFIEFFNLDKVISYQISIFDDEKIFILNNYNLSIYHYDNSHHSLIFNSMKKFSASLIIPLTKNYLIISVENKLYFSTKEEIEKLEEKDCYESKLYGIMGDNVPYISFENLHKTLGNYFMNFNSSEGPVKFNLLLNNNFCISYGKLIYIYSYPNIKLITKLVFENFSQLYQVSNNVYILYDEEIQILGENLKKLKTFKLNKAIDKDNASLSNNTITNIYFTNSNSKICTNCLFNKVCNISLSLYNSYVEEDFDFNNLDSCCEQPYGLVISLQQFCKEYQFFFNDKNGQCMYCGLNI